MATQLLHCCICPKQPDFSDTSHLLTHVSSKGHLSYLHKLQVRSHQEVLAGQQLAFYNQWFSEHNVADMLSERMQQKEMKQARKQADNNRRCVATKRGHQSNVDPTLLPADNHTKLESSGSSAYASNTNLSSNYPHLDGSPYEFARQPSLFPALPVSLTDPWCYVNRSPIKSTNSSPDRNAYLTPEAAKLKGVIWPGMDIFDSANQETQRKRNQKKDVSVLEKMQSMSELVEPMEMVCSPGGTVKKRRHMNDLEDDSPVEGESPVLKQSSRRKRKPLAAISVNAKGAVRHRSKPAQASARDLITPTKRYPAFRKSKNSRQLDQGRASMDDNQDAFAARIAQQGRRGFQRLSNSPDISTSMHRNDVLSNPFLRNGHEAHSFQKPLTFPSTPWLQPTQRSGQVSDPFKAYRPFHVLPDAYSDTTTDKENVNPLLWSRGLSTAVSSPVDHSYHTFDDFDDGLGALAEVYAFTKNPLLRDPSEQGALSTQRQVVDVGSKDFHRRALYDNVGQQFGGQYDYRT